MSAFPEGSDVPAGLASSHSTLPQRFLWVCGFVFQISQLQLTTGRLPSSTALKKGTCPMWHMSTSLSGKKKFVLYDEMWHLWLGGKSDLFYDRYAKPYKSYILIYFTMASNSQTLALVLALTSAWPRHHLNVKKGIWSQKLEKSHGEPPVCGTYPQVFDSCCLPILKPFEICRNTCLGC